MLKKSLFIAFVCFLFSCDKKSETKIQSNVLTANQIKIISFYKPLNRFTKTKTNLSPIEIERLAKNENQDFKAIVNIICAITYANRTSYELARKHNEKALYHLKNSKLDSLKARVYIGLGGYNKEIGNFDKAFDNYFKALKIFDKSKDYGGIASTYNFLGEICMQKDDFKQAKEYLNKTLSLLKNKTDSPNYLQASHTLANIYGMSGDFKSALAIDEKSIKICDKIKSIGIKAMFVDNKANCFMYSNQLDSAEFYFDECLKLDLKINNQKQIADTYSNQGYLALLKKDFQKAETLTLKSISILNTIKHKPNILSTYDKLCEIHVQQNRFEKALETKNAFIKEYKNLINEKKEAATAEYKLVYETEKKEKLLAENKIVLLENEASSRKLQYIIVSISLLTVLIGIIGFLYSRQQKLKVQQQQQEFKLNSAISEIQNQNKLQEQRLSISRDLHDNIGSQLTFIISSVDNVKYGFNIDNPKLDNKLTNISSFAKDTILELRDTIWAMNSNEISYEDLEVRINNFIDKAKTSQEKISFSFAIAESLKTQKLTSIQGMNIYRTIQEAVNNTLKYANASVVAINVKQVDNQTKITISDNGNGFDMATIEKGNGLNNMKKRIEEIGGKFDLNSGKEGTRIVVLI